MSATVARLVAFLLVACQVNIISFSECSIFVNNFVLRSFLAAVTCSIELKVSYLVEHTIAVNMHTIISVAGVFVNVNGSDFYIDKNLVSRAESKELCESLNMTLISFETAEKWTMISDWTFANGTKIYRLLLEYDLV